MSTSDHIFTKFSILDPALMDKQIEDAISGSVFDKFSLLDPAHQQAQIEAFTGRTVFSNLRGITDPTWTPDALALAMGLDTSP